jgi:transcriptional regulator with GAF, ATPase, and Fis domain
LQAIPLRRLLDKRQTGALLEACAGLDVRPVTLGLADIKGDWLASYPTAPIDDALVRRVCDTGHMHSDERSLAVPLIVDEELYGVLYTSPPTEPLSKALRQALEMLIEGALSQKSLAKETLERYREINLLYRVHETIGSSLELAEVIGRMLEESIRIIKAEGGSVLLADRLTDRLSLQDSVGVDIAEAEEALISLILSEKVFETGKPRILNDLENYVRPPDPKGVQISSLLCAPLKSTENTLGVITLGRLRSGAMFTAGDQKLLTALASQAGIAIANAREVEAREHRLRQQIEALRIEIDEAKKQREVYAITESEYFTYLQENARKMREEFNA